MLGDCFGVAMVAMNTTEGFFESKNTKERKRFFHSLPQVYAEDLLARLGVVLYRGEPKEAGMSYYCPPRHTTRTQAEKNDS